MNYLTASLGMERIILLYSQEPYCGHHFSQLAARLFKLIYKSRSEL